MSRVQTHLRTTLLTGLFAFIPLAITIYIIWLVDEKTASIIEYLTAHTPGLAGKHIPLAGLAGLVIIVAIVYLIGLAGSSLVGRWFLGHLDAVLSRLPVLRTLYISWKQVALTPGGTEGVFSHIVLVPESDDLYAIGFSSMRPLPNDPQSVCVLVFNAPTPTTGRMFFVRRDRCVELPITAEEAFKVILSAGNYIAPELGAAMATLSAGTGLEMKKVELTPPPPRFTLPAAPPAATPPPAPTPAPANR